MLLDLYNEDPYEFIFNCINLRMSLQQFEYYLRQHCGATFTETENIYIAVATYAYRALCSLIDECGLIDLVGNSLMVTQRLYNAIILEKIECTTLLRSKGLW